MLDLKDILIIATRLVLELISYYNAKIMYSLTGMSKISPVLTLYITHSMGSLLFLRDLYKYRGNYLNILKRDTQVMPYMFIFHAMYLSLFYNLCHIPKFYAMNSLSDISIVTIYGSSVLFTYIFAVMILKSNLDRKGIFSLMLGVVGVILLLMDDESIRVNFPMTVILFISSIFSGLYGVLFKLSMNSKIKINIKVKEDLSKETNKAIIDKNIEGIDAKEKIRRLEEKILENGISKNKAFNSTKTPKEKNINFRNDINIHNINDKNIDFYKVPTDISLGSVSTIGDIDNKNEKIKKDTRDKITVFRHEISKETHRKLLYMRHYLALTGIITFFFYWPGLVVVKYLKLEPLFFPTSLRPLFHVFIANAASLIHIVVYFIIVCSRSPLFAQISGIILQPTFLFIRIAKDSGTRCALELLGCTLSFVSFLALSNIH